MPGKDKFFPSFFAYYFLLFFPFSMIFQHFSAYVKSFKSTCNLMELRKSHEEKKLSKGPELLGRAQVLTKLHKAMQEGIVKSWVARWRKVHKSQLKIFLNYLFLCLQFVWNMRPLYP